MALPTSGVMKSSMIRDEFKQGNPVAIGNYTRGGAIVTNSTANSKIKTTKSLMNWSDYYGAASAVNVKQVITFWNANPTLCYYTIGDGQFTQSGDTPLNNLVQWSIYNNDNNTLITSGSIEALKKATTALPFQKLLTLTSYSYRTITSSPGYNWDIDVTQAPTTANGAVFKLRGNEGGTGRRFCTNVNIPSVGSTCMFDGGLLTGELTMIGTAPG